MQVLIRTRIQKYKKLHNNSCTDNMNKTTRKRELAQFLIDDRPVTRILFGGVLTRPKWTKLPKRIFYCLIRLVREVAIHEKL